VRLFASEGTTPMHWLWERRLREAHRLLSNQVVSRVKDAALAAGFSDMSHFSRAFRAAFGQSPLEVLTRNRTRGP
jgi:transcriptional regulator GlxA family with amidase domain